MKAPFVIYADLECLLNKIYTCHNNQNSSFTQCSFNVTRNKYDYYRGKDCMKKFCEDLRKHATKIINYDKKKMIPLTIEENKS